MALKSVLTAYKNRVNSSSGGTGGLTIANAYTGWHARLVTSDSVWTDASTNGPFAVLSLPTLGVNHNHVGPAEIKCDIFIAKSKQESWTGSDVCDLIDNVIDRLLDASAADYNSTNQGIIPEEVTVEGYDYIYENNPGLLVVHLSIAFTDPTVPPPNSPPREG